MTEITNGCPSEETLGAFLEGSLHGAERDAVVAHLATCDRCLGGAEFVTRVRTAPSSAFGTFSPADAGAKDARLMGSPKIEHRAEATDARLIDLGMPSNRASFAPRSGEKVPKADEGPVPIQSRTWMSIAAAIALLAVSAVLVQQWRGRQQPGIRTLIAAAPAGYRTVEPRLAGFPWRALQSLRADQTAQDPETLRLGGAAGDVLLRAEHDHSTDTAHAAGVADLLLQRSADAIDRLRTAAEGSGSAAAWNDLAAAYYASAVYDGHTADLPRALAAADRAIAADGTLNEARFNRALILERMSLRAEAAAAWRDYLSHDPSSPWAAEARKHLDALPPKPAASTQTRGEAEQGPPADVAQLRQARIAFDQNHVDEATQLLASLAPAPQYVALRAEIALRLGRCHQYAGRWDEAVRDFTGAAQLFTSIHDRGNAAFAAAHLGDTFDELGAYDDAWRQRIAAFAQHERPVRMVATLAAAVRSELKAGELETARSLLALELHETAALGDPLLEADALRRGALIDAQLGDDNAAAQSIARSRALMARAPASGIRERLAIETTIAEASVRRRRDPRRAIALLAASMPFLTSAGDRIFLPDALLENGRALRAAGRNDEALAAFRAGVDEIEAQRSTAPAGSAIFDAAAPLVEETVSLQLARNDAAGAFDTVERAHGGAALPATARQVSEALAPGTMLVAYALIPGGVAAICVTRNGVEAVQQTIARRALADDIRRLRAAIAARNEAVKTRAAALDELLLQRLPGVEGATSLIIVPDRVLHSVPWGALFDPSRGRFAIEDYALTVAPNAALYLARSAAAPQPQARLLMVRGAARGLDPLTDEAAGYRDRLTLAGPEATPEQLFALAARADVVHFAGHARLGAEPALLLGADRELRASDIARTHLSGSRLIVLAACGTAEGDGNGFDGPHGLAQAFLTAGAGAVVGTLWPVDDAEASALFTEFHRRLRGGEDAAAALRHAQLSLLHGGDPRSRQPAAWAAAELFGANIRIGGSNG